MSKNLSYLREKSTMECEQYIREWMEENRDEMILCPNQPGYLRISRKGCVRRYLAAKEGIFESISKNDPFYYVLKTGMDRCISCNIGKRYACIEEEKAKGAVG
jgi:hypothetical protein